MLRIPEDRLKAWLRERGLPVPQGVAADSPEEAARHAQSFGGKVVVKALIPTGRRGKAGAVIVASDPPRAAEAARELLGRTVNGFVVEEVYVEAYAPIACELYLGFAFEGTRAAVAASIRGGVDIEEVVAHAPNALVSIEPAPLRGLPVWDAVALWQRAGLTGPALPALATLTARLWTAFCEGDALTLELNPVGLDADGRPALIGAMMGIDESALFRHRGWVDLQARESLGRSLNAREQRVVEGNRTLPGGAVRYIELDGDIGLLVGGGGAGLLVADLMRKYGGRPANHTDTSPGPITEKLKVIFRAIFDNPRVRGLLLAYNRQQMSQCPLKIEALGAVLRERGIDPRTFPIVIRLAGAGEERARVLAAEFAGLHYLPTHASLEDAVRRIVELTDAAKAVA